MKVSRTRIAQVVADRSVDGDTKELSREVAAYLLSENRVGELDSLLRDVRTDWATAGYVEVLARSAFSLSPEVKADITAQTKALYPKAQKIIVSEIHDPSVIGGVQLSLADRQWDLTIEAKLNRFKRLTAAGKE